MSEVKIVVDNSGKTKEEMRSAVRMALEACGIQCEGNAMLELENNPRRIDTGYLRDSITHTMSGENSVYIGTNVEYALYVHDGTSKMTPNRFMRNALENHRNEYIDIIKNYMQ